MAVTRLRWRIFTQGWFGTGARDAMPENTLRRAVGISYTKTTELRSRYGSVVIADLDAHSVARYNGHRFMGVDTRFYLDGRRVIQEGLDGTKLTCVRAQPTVDVADYLFVAGGKHMFKVGPDAVASLWGIIPPPNGFAATPDPPETRPIMTMDDVSGWTDHDGITSSAETVIKQEGTGSLHLSMPANEFGHSTKAITIDLTTYPGGSVSSAQDFIAFWLYVDRPGSLDTFQLEFSLGNATFASDTMVYRYDTDPDPPTHNSLRKQDKGIGSVFKRVLKSPITIAKKPEILLKPAAFTAEVTGGLLDFDRDDPEAVTATQDAAGQTKVPNLANTWTLMRTPKSVFARTGATAGLDWDDVQAIRWTISTNDLPAVNVYIDDLQLLGAYGLQGTYKYHVTYKNGATGTRSNPNLTPVEVPNVMRQSLQITNLPQPTDPQVTHIEVWRTVGNGTLHFKIGEVAVGTTTFHDVVSDAATLDSRPDAALMTDIELPFDNLRPDDSWDDVFGPYAGCLFWTRSPITGERGKVFFSPPGRAEAAAGYLTVSSDDEPALKGIVFNGAAYVWTTRGVYQILGTGPFSSRKIYGVPGTLWPLSVALTPYGVAYLANDGPRLFDGNMSKLLSNAPVSLLFRNEAVEDIRFILDA